MSSGPAWHPRHPDLQRPSRREDVVQYVDPSEPVFLDEAEVLPEEVECHFADAVGAVEAAAVAAQQTDEVLAWFAQRPSEMRLAQIPAHLRQQAEEILQEHQAQSETEQRRLREQAESREAVRL
ncbi:MAG: hypothetical protein WKF65_02265 [Gaiellaceae bacterium]